MTKQAHVTTEHTATPAELAMAEAAITAAKQAAIQVAAEEVKTQIDSVRPELIKAARDAGREVASETMGKTAARMDKLSRANEYGKLAFCASGTAVFLSALVTGGMTMARGRGMFGGDNERGGNQGGDGRSTPGGNNPEGINGATAGRGR